jgi:hypothetical protein
LRITRGTALKPARVKTALVACVFEVVCRCSFNNSSVIVKFKFSHIWILHTSPVEPDAATYIVTRQRQASGFVAVVGGGEVTRPSSGGGDVMEK